MKMQRLQPVVAEDLVEEVREGGTSPAAMLLVKKGKKVLPSGSGTSEPARSSVLPFSLLSPAVSKRVAARFFSETLGVSRAGSYKQAAQQPWPFRAPLVASSEGD